MGAAGSARLEKSLLLGEVFFGCGTFKANTEREYRGVVTEHGVNAQYDPGSDHISTRVAIWRSAKTHGVGNINLHHSRRNTRRSNGVDLCAQSTRAMSSARYRRVRSVICVSLVHPISSGYSSPESPCGQCWGFAGSVATGRPQTQTQPASLAGTPKTNR